jgi:hypothetical protein
VAVVALGFLLSRSLVKAHCGARTSGAGVVFWMLAGESSSCFHGIQSPTERFSSCQDVKSLQIPTSKLVSRNKNLKKVHTKKLIKMYFNNI